jgi:hypothetical protein
VTLGGDDNVAFATRDMRKELEGIVSDWIVHRDLKIGILSSIVKQKNQNLYKSTSGIV